MNYLLCLIVWAGLVFPAFAEADKELVPAYQIRYVKDASIAADKAVFRFTVNGNNIPPGTLLLFWAADGKNREEKLEKRTFDVTLPKGNHHFQFYINDHFEITIPVMEFDGGQRVEVDLHFTHSEIQIMVEKPVIYLYPEQQQSVSIRVQPAGKLLFTYPAYENGWNVTANAKGTITDDGKEYPYLFWDAETAFSMRSVDSNGFIVEQERVVPFLEEQLETIGLNARERTDFITYWGPRLIASEKVFLQFIWGQGADRFASLQILPQPDHVNRLYLVWSAVDDAAGIPECKPQQLPVFDRSGFDVLEWGGVQLTQTFTAFSSAD